MTNTTTLQTTPPLEPTLETLFGLTVSVTPPPFPLAERISAAALTARDAPAPVLAELRRDAEHYLALRRKRALRLPAALEMTCDEQARTVMRLTVSTPPLPMRAVRLVA